MKGLLSRRPSPALVVATVALVVAMFGTAYAATQLPKNSVGSKQLKAKSVTAAKIKKNAVTGAKVKDQSLTGKDINAGTLGTVPSANVANSLAPAEAIHFVGLPGEPPFQAGSSNYPPEGGLNLAPVGFYKDHDGIVHLEGIAKVGKESVFSGFAPVFTLPPGFRPAVGISQIFGSGINGALVFGTNVSVEGQGVSGVVAGSKEQAVILSGITFRAAS